MKNICLLLLVVTFFESKAQQVLGNFSGLDQDEWPEVIWYRNTANGWDEGLIKNSSSNANSVFGRAGFGIHMEQSKQFTFWSTGWTPLFAIQGGTGNAYLKGNVGIGTPTPSAPLEISKSGPPSGTFLSLDDQATTGRTGVRLRFQSNGVAHWNVGIPANTDAYTINGWGGATNPEFFRINSTGNVGIGTTNPTSGLTVSTEGSNYTDGAVFLANSTNTSIGGGATIAGIKSARTDDGGYNLLKIQNATNTKFLVTGTGDVGIGTPNPDAKLAVNGTIHSKEVKVDMNGWSDYVFDPTYDLPSLTSVKSYIDKNHRLPEIPSTQEVLKNGINLGEIVNLQMKKIEELTLYLIEQQKINQSLQSQINQLKNK